MNAGPDVERRISDWLADEGSTRAPDRILPATFERTRHTRQRRFGAAWRLFTMNRTWQLATASVVGLLILGLGAVWLGGSRGVTGPAAAPSPTPTPRPYPTSGLAEPGTYGLRFPGLPTVTFTVPAGWGFGGAGGPAKNDGTSRSMGLTTWTIANVYADPCKWGDGALIPPVGPSVDDLANALAKQPVQSGKAPTPVTLDGFSGKYLELTTPTSMSPSTCSPVPGTTTPGFFVRWIAPDDGYMGFAGPGSHDRVWILDVRGVRFVIAATDFADATAQDRAELQSIIDSIRIEPVPPTPSASPTASR